MLHFTPSIYRMQKRPRRFELRFPMYSIGPISDFKLVVQSGGSGHLSLGCICSAETGTSRHIPRHLGSGTGSALVGPENSRPTPSSPHPGVYSCWGKPFNLCRHR